MTGEQAVRDAAEMKKLRRENPSAWLELTDNSTLPFIIDALLDSPPGREFNKKELGDFAGVSRESVRKHIGTLLKFGIITEVSDTDPQRYQLNDRGKATKEIFELNSALNAAGASEDKDILKDETESKETYLQPDFPDEDEHTFNIELSDS